MKLNYCFLPRNRQRREKATVSHQLSSLKRTDFTSTQGDPILRWRMSTASESWGTKAARRHGGLP